MTPVDALMNSVEWKPVAGSCSDGSGLPWATHEGVLNVGGIEFKCYQLNDGRRVLDAESINRFFSVKDQAKCVFLKPETVS